MITIEIYQALKKKLKVPVYTEQPDAEVKRYVIVSRTSGGKDNHIRSATITLQSYAGSLYEAAKLNEEAKAAFEQLVELPDIGSIRLNNDYPFPDPVRKRHRYQAVYNITHY